MRPKKTGRAQTGVSILTGITKSQFSRIHRSMIFYLKNTKFAVEVPAYNRKLHSKVEVNRTSRFRHTIDQSLSFCSSFFFLLILLLLHKHKNHSNSGMHTLIKLKFGTHVGQPKVNINAKFCEDPTKILVVINDYSCKQRSICWPAYRINCWLDRSENRYVARFNIRRVLFGG